MGSNFQSVINSGAGIRYQGLEQLSVLLGSGQDSFSVQSVAGGTQTTIDAGAGNDAIAVGDSLVNIGADLLLRGGSGTSNTLEITSTTDSNLRLSSMEEGQLGLLQGAPGDIAFTEWSSLELSLGDSPDSVVIEDTTVPLTIRAGGGGQDTIEVINLSHPTTVATGDGADLVTVFATAAELTIDGSGTGDDTLVIDRTAVSAAVQGGILGNGVLQRVTAGDILFDEMELIDVRLGSGNDDLEINQTLPNTRVSIEGDGGDDLVRVISVGALETRISGGSEEDTVRVVIDGFPQDQQFTTLALTTEILLVDNSSNSGPSAIPVAWTHRSGLLEADTIPSTGRIGVIPTTGGFDARDRWDRGGFARDHQRDRERHRGICRW